MAKRKREHIGFVQALEYILDLMCYSYYVKHDNLVSDQAFDGVESLYRKLTGFDTCPRRGIEFEGAYSYGVKVVYDLIIDRANKNKEDKPKKTKKGRKNGR